MSCDAERAYIVCVDDESSVLDVLREQLYCHFGERYDVEIATSGEEAHELIEDIYSTEDEVAAVIADQLMPGMKGSELLRVVNEKHPDIKKVLLTGQAGLDAVIEAVNFGGLNHYVAKPWKETELRMVLDSLLRQRELEMENQRLVRELDTRNRQLKDLNERLQEMVNQRTRQLEQANARLEKLAITDGLTGLFNHRHLRERLAEEIDRAHRTGEPVSLIMGDVDRFKSYNDNNGHMAGDQALKKIAQILKTGRRAGDIVARYGGEEFLLVLIGAPKSAGIKVADYLRRRIQETEFEGEENQPGGALTISFGVSEYPEDGCDVPDLIVAADKGLYSAKAAGRNTVHAAPGRKTEEDCGPRRGGRASDSVSPLEANTD